MCGFLIAFPKIYSAYPIIKKLAAQLYFYFRGFNIGINHRIWSLPTGQRRKLNKHKTLRRGPGRVYAEFTSKGHGVNFFWDKHLYLLFQNLAVFGKSIFFSNKLQSVKSNRIRSYSNPYSVQMQENLDQKTPNTDFFYAVLIVSNILQCSKVFVVSLFY